MIEVELPDGTIAEFPDGTPPDVMKGALQKRFPKPSRSEPVSNPSASSLPGPFGDFQNTSRAMQSGATQGMTLGFGDELEGAAFAVPEALGNMFQGKGFDLGQGYNQAVDRARGMNKTDAELNPIANVAGTIGGNMTLGGALSNGGISFMKGAVPTLGSMAGRGALEGAAYGAVTGLGEGDSLQSRVAGALTGGGLGGAVGGVLGGVAGKLANSAMAKGIPASESIKSEAGQLYDAAKGSPVLFPQQDVKNVADTIAAKAISEGLDPTLHPGATAALQRLQMAAGDNMTVQDALTIRRVLGAAAKDFNNPDQTRIAKDMVRQFDDYVSTSVPEVSAANGVYATGKKTQLIEDTIQKAHDMSSANYSASGFENALRQQFKNLLTSRNALQGFSDDEVAAIRKVAEGGTVENVLRYLGKLAPTGVISTGISGGAGYALGGPAGAAAVLGTGAAARKAATAATMDNANLARALVAGRGSIPGVSAKNSDIVRALIQSGAGAASGMSSDLVAKALAGQNR